MLPCHAVKLVGLPFLRSSGLPFLTVAKTMSPHAAAGKRLRRPRMPPTAMMYRFLAPENEKGVSVQDTWVARA